MTTYICQYCSQTLKFEIGRGYVHSDGGIYMMLCRDCKFEAAYYPSPIKCPRCDSNNFIDEHCVLPIKKGASST